jgi:hypothetical protein
MCTIAQPMSAHTRPRMNSGARRSIPGSYSVASICAGCPERIIAPLYCPDVRYSKRNATWKKNARISNNTKVASKVAVNRAGQQGGQQDQTNKPNRVASSRAAREAREAREGNGKAVSKNDKTIGKQGLG